MHDKSMKVALVTGGNRGIGLGVVRGLAQQLNVEHFLVYLASRDIGSGNEAAKQLVGEGLENVKSLQIDITDERSVEEAAKFIKESHDGLDILVNNAGIAFKVNDTASFSEQAQKTVATNYFGTERMMNAFLPLLRPGARVVIVTSNCGHLSKINGDEPKASELRAKLSSPSLSQEELGSLMRRFVSLAGEGAHTAAGWPNSAYKVSKVGVSALARLMQAQVDSEMSGKARDIAINHAHPGYVATDMSSFKGHWSVEEGARSIIHAATLPPHTLIRGEYIWEDCNVTSWVEEQVNLFY